MGGRIEKEKNEAASSIRANISLHKSMIRDFFPFVPPFPGFDRVTVTVTSELRSHRQEGKRQVLVNL